MMTRAQGTIRVPIAHESDVVVARSRARELAATAGLAAVAIEELVTAISEVAHNIVVHAGTGEILVERVEWDGRMGVAVMARDRGPGIVDVEQAMLDGFSTTRTLGLGLSSARRLVHDFTLSSTPGLGTTITMDKWA